MGVLIAQPPGPYAGMVVRMRLVLKDVHPALFTAEYTPKALEAVAIRDPHRIRRYTLGPSTLKSAMRLSPTVTVIACPGGRSVSWATFTYAAMSQLLLALIHDDSVAAHVESLLASHGRNRPRKVPA